MAAVVVVAGLMACPPPPKPPTTLDALDGGDEDAGGDAGLFEIGHRDAGPLYLDHGLPWSWSSVEEVIKTPPASGGLTGRWVPVFPSSVDRAWAGGVLLFDGGVVAVPFNENAVLMIHPSDGTSERWPVAGGAVEEGWQGGVLLPDGKVLAFPRNADRFLLIDPATRTAEPYGDDLSGASDGGVDKFRGGVLGLNGQVYAAPSNSNFIARMNPATGRVTRIPIPATIRRGGTMGAVLFPTGDIVMFPAFDGPGLLVIPSRSGGEDEVWLIPHAPVIGPPAFNAGGVITSAESAVAPPHQNALPLRYEAGVFAYLPALPGVAPTAANAWFFAAWSTNGHFYSPPFGQNRAISFSLDGSSTLEAFDPGIYVFRSVLGVVALPDGRVIGIPHARSAWLELTPPGTRSMPIEAFTSPFLNKL